MAKSKQLTTTEKNLDRLADFLTNEMEHPALAAQIPDGAHIFHGTYEDIELTQANAKMAAAILMEMALGICEEAPLVMLFEYKPGQQTVIDLATEDRKRKAQRLVEAFQEQSQQEVVIEINELMAA